MRTQLLRATAVVLLAAAGHTQSVRCTSYPDGAQAGTGSNAFGGAIIEVDAATNTLSYSWGLTFNTQGPITNLRIHGPAVPGAAGPALVALGPGSVLSGSWNYPQSVEPALLGGLTYLSIETTVFPGGELRGQIVPDPSLECDCTIAVAPCGNGSDFFTGGCTNGINLTGLIGFNGQSSVGLDSLTVNARNLPPNQFGLIYMGTGALALPFGDGVRCAGGTTYRYAIQNSGGTGFISTGFGVVGQSIANFPPAGQIQSGQTWIFQGWHRDPSGPCGSGFNTTNALRVTFTP